MVRAFTLLEMMVSVAIFGIISAVVLASNSEFNNTVLLTNTAYDIGLSIRQAQSYGVSTRVINNSFDSGYGVAFANNNQTSYYMFADTDKSRTYNGSDVLLSTMNLNGGYTITRFCAVMANLTEHCSTGTSPAITNLWITFLRPDTDATIRTDQFATYSTAKITVSRNGKIRVIYVTATGQISVKSS